MLYGFNQEHARLLKGVARREGLKPRTGVTVKYPKPLPDDSPVRLGKPDANIANGASGTVSIWTGTAGSETDSGENITAWVRGASVIQSQWVRVHGINGQWYIVDLTNEAIGKPDSSIAKGSSGTVSIWTGSGGSESDSGINVTAYAKGAAVTSAKFVILGNINGVWYVAPWET